MSQSQRKKKQARTKSKDMFGNFVEYWHFAKYLTKNQRDVVFDSLNPSQRRKILQSYKRGGWEDVFLRNSLNEVVDDIKENFGYDLIEIRAKVLNNKSVYIPRSFWDYVQFVMDEFSDDHKSFVIGGIEGYICEENSEVVLLLPSN